MNLLNSFYFIWYFRDCRINLYLKEKVSIKNHNTETYIFKLTIILLIFSLSKFKHLQLQRPLYSNPRKLAESFDPLGVGQAFAAPHYNNNNNRETGAIVILLLLANFLCCRSLSLLVLGQQRQYFYAPGLSNYKFSTCVCVCGEEIDKTKLAVKGRFLYFPIKVCVFPPGSFIITESCVCPPPKQRVHMAIKILREEMCEFVIILFSS